MPQLVRLYIGQVLIGFGLSAIFVAGLLWADVARLRSLIMATQGGWMALFLLFFFNGLVFAGVQFAIKIMGMAEKPEPPSGGRRGHVAPMVPPKAVAVKVAGPQRP